LPVNPTAVPPSGPPDLSAAVEAASAGDEDAFGILYTAVQPGLLRYLRALVGQDAEDVASETWLQIARDLRTYRGDTAGFRTWAATVARNRAIDHLRRVGRRPAVAVPVEQLEHLANAEDTALLAVEAVSTNAAIALIATLPRDQAEAVLLRVVVGLDAQAAAQVLGKRSGAVRTAAHRGLRRLARQLEQHRTVDVPRPVTVTVARPVRPALVHWVTDPNVLAPKDTR
jgi:RNA polymerase sigma-70 factor (ECF subfamily)